jgi:cation:H+ antiporter
MDFFEPMIVSFFWIAVALVLLILGAEWLVRGSASVALKLGITPLMVGLTVVAFGTSSPELVVSVRAAMAGLGDVAVGNAVGSNLFNVGIILGLTALICPIAIKSQIIRVDGPIMIGTAILVLLVMRDGVITRVEGAALFVGIVAYTWTNWVLSKREVGQEVKAEYSEGVPSTGAAWWVDLGLIVFGVGVLVLGSRLLVDNCLVVARGFGVSEAVISLTIIAAGTSMPELATSVVAALRRQPDIAIGNVVGSNIFNVLSILGLSALVEPLVARGIRDVDLYWMIGLSIFLLPLMWMNLKLRRVEGALLLGCYGAYLWTLWPK